MLLRKKLCGLGLILVLLTGCNMFGPTAEEQMYEHLERAVVLESSFEEQQKPLVDLEKEEKKIYDEILKLGMSEFEKIQNLSDQALALTKERKERIEQEKESIEASKKEFEMIFPLIEGIEDQAVKSKANELKEIMIKRYDSYSSLYDSYQEALKYDQGLYNLFKKKELTLEELENQIKKVNQSYEKVIAANEEFNEQTKAYNDVKKNFYQMAELEVIFE